MVMKMHSYITVNGQLQQISEQSDELLASLRKASESVGGWEEAMTVAQTKQAEHETLQTNSSASQLSTPPNGTSSTHEPTPIGTPKVPEGSTASSVDVKAANALRKRLAAVAAQAQVRGDLTNDENVGVRAVHNLSKTSSQLKDAPTHRPTIVVEADELPIGPAPHPLVFHPDPQISDMAKDYSELQSELTSAGPLFVRWPDTITWKNFALYQLIPTLVYELEYPRTNQYVRHYCSVQFSLI